jgi:hypothetical protein
MPQPNAETASVPVPPLSVIALTRKLPHRRQAFGRGILRAMQCRER